MNERDMQGSSFMATHFLTFQFHCPRIFPLTLTLALDQKQCTEDYQYNWHHLCFSTFQLSLKLKVKDCLTTFKKISTISTLNVKWRMFYARTDFTDFISRYLVGESEAPLWPGWGLPAATTSGLACDENTEGLWFMNSVMTNDRLVFQRLLQ